MARLRLLSIDLDGTLVDSAGEITEAVQRMLVELGLARRQAAEIIGLVGHGTRALVERLFERLRAERALGDALPDIEVAHACFDRHYAQLAGRTAQPYPGCVAALERLQAAGIVLACVTNKEQRHAERVLAGTGLARWFTTLIAGDTLPWKKPDARVIGALLARHGVAAAECAHVGDSAIDVEAARAAGVAAWALPEGYNGGRPIEAARPDRLFADLAALAAHVCETRIGTSTQGRR
ncbi:MAG TPA: HAD-IA family hydrolase [Methylibium sp.]|nr:HAD-IA family hydrolase [Methylibium sp.]